MSTTTLNSKHSSAELCRLRWCLKPVVKPFSAWDSVPMPDNVYLRAAHTGSQAYAARVEEVGRTAPARALVPRVTSRGRATLAASRRPLGGVPLHVLSCLEVRTPFPDGVLFSDRQRQEERPLVAAWGRGAFSEILGSKMHDILEPQFWKAIVSEQQNDPEERNPFWTPEQVAAFREHNNRVKMCLAACAGIPDADLPADVQGLLAYLKKLENAPYEPLLPGNEIARKIAREALALVRKGG